MQIEGLSPDVITFTCILTACTNIQAIEKGKQIHDDIVSKGFLKKDAKLANALVDMYSRCRMLEKAQEVHDELHFQDVVSWSALISGYSQEGQGYEALNCFQRMRNEGLSPDSIAFVCVLNACANTRDVNNGKQIHDQIHSMGLIQSNVPLGGALVDMYAKCGMLEAAQQVLEELPIRNEISWSALITGYVQHGYFHEALKCLEWMQKEGFSPDAVTFICALKACGSTGAIAKGKQIHDEIHFRGLMEKNSVLGNALVDMYAKCGVLANACQVHDELGIRNTVSWSALIAGYAQQGQGYHALQCSEQMQSEGFPPDSVTILCILNACSHSGLLDEAQTYFKDMVGMNRVPLALGHCTCMVVVFGYCGHFNKALSVIKAMPSSDYVPVWLALLGACRKWSNVMLGILAFDRVAQIESYCAAAYVLMIDIYTSVGMHEDAKKIKAMRVENESL